MKAWLSILVIVALSNPSLTSAQDSASNDLNTMLRDASYIFNRFEEVSAGLQVQIDMNYPVGIRKSSKGALSGTLGNVATEKVALNALLGHSKVPSADLLDVYIELVEVERELNDESTNNANWGDQQLAVDLAQLGSKTAVLGARVAMALRSQIVAQELQLASCTQKTPSHKSE
jgi:hypothetical protein